jgi:hypothetical protein
MNIDNQSELELSVFRKFATISEMGIITESIEKREPDEPDILCKSRNNEYVAFELVRLVAEKDAHRSALWKSTVRALNEIYINLPTDKKAIFDEKYGSASIYLHFQDTFKMNIRTTMISKALDYLVSLPSQLRGTARVKSINGLSFISANEINSTSPKFNTNNGGFTNDPTKKLILQKCKKKYVTQHPVELLAHYSSLDVLPKDIWLPIVEDIFNEDFSKGVFRRFWFYNEDINEVQYRHP